MNILGIETSCDETAVAVVEDAKNVVSSIIASQAAEHSIYGGVVPEIASRRHIENITQLVRKCIESANLTLNNIDGIAVTFGPGLVGALLVGINFAKGLSFALKKPLIAVNHLKAHIAANYVTDKSLTPPFLGLIISGGHCNIVRVKNYCEFELIGETVDDSIGEAYDKVGRALGIAYPAGAIIDSMAKLGDENAYIFPKPKVEGSMYNFSFSGLKTAVLNVINSEKMQNKVVDIKNIAASFQKTACDIVCEKIFLAAKRLGEKKIVACGGVCANSRIRSELKKYSELNNIRLYLPNLNLCTDNAVMVAAQGYFEFKNGNFEKNMSLNAQSNVKIG